MEPSAPVKDAPASYSTASPSTMSSVLEVGKIVTEFSFSDELKQPESTQAKDRNRPSVTYLIMGFLIGEIIEYPQVYKSTIS